VVNAGDVLVSRACGSPRLVGSTGRVSALRYRLILSDKTFRPVFKDDVDPDFAVHAMNSAYYREQVAQAISGAEGLANNLPLSALRDFVFSVPPLAEQRRICAAIRSSLEELEPRRALFEHEVTLAYEYRIRLISDVVTGQLDVRAAAASLPALGPDTTPTEPDPDEVTDIDDDEAA
jgi:type I restriction enzyme S subunit